VSDEDDVPEEDLDEDDGTVPFAALSIDYERRVLILEFAQPVELFGMDLDTARGLAEAMLKGVRSLQDS